MTSPPRGRHKPVSDDRRERDVFSLYGAAFRDLPHIDELGPNSETCRLPSTHVPKASRDSTLTALAQLATLRLGAQRAMISLLDDSKQYILAEATPDMSIFPDSTGDHLDKLWLGSVSIPRTWASMHDGMCESVLNIDLQAFDTSDSPTVVIRDLKQSIEHSSRTYIKETSVRFYAGAPLISPAGAIVGALSVLDDIARPDGLSNAHRHSLHDISRSIMDYLHTYTIKDQLWRGERFTRGLISFSEGADTLLPFRNTIQRDPEMPQEHGIKSTALESPHDERSDPLATGGQPPSLARPISVRTKSTQQRATEILQDSILPTNARMMFSRAANVMLASSDLDGVIILDASVAANRNRRRSGSQEVSSTGTGTEETYEPSQSPSSSSDGGSPHRVGSADGSRSKPCQILGSATRATPEYNTNSTFPLFEGLDENDLATLLQDHPNGKIMTFGTDGLPFSSTEDSGSGASNIPHSRPTRRRSTKSRSNRTARAVNNLLPDARSVAFVPFWDYERLRWFAGCLCWSNRPQRLLSANLDLAYFKVFGHSVMRELSRLDALALNQAKTTFVASISHELRSPLHGILGTLEFIKDTSLDSFQTSMFNSLNACGQTLLDTMEAADMGDNYRNHVMDYAQISEATRNVSSRKLKSTHTVRLSSKPLKSRRSRAAAFDLSIATEEVVEAVFSGSSYVPVTAAFMETASSPSKFDTSQMPIRKTCYVVLDLAPEDDWVFCFPVGSWRRIVMNVFGNAIKYTKSGHIHISLRVSGGSKATGTPATVCLTVTDSGIGMSPQFLANRAFQPFSQENSFASGTGLGLSIIRQIIETNGGKIEVNSEPHVGTKLTVKLALTRPEAPSATSPPITVPRHIQFLDFRSRLEGMAVCILERDLGALPHDPDMGQTIEGLRRFTDVLAKTLQKRLKMNVVRSATGHDYDSQIVIVPELSFEYLSFIRRSRIKGHRAPITIFIAMDALEASTLRSDARVRSKESVVEIMTQPCGPFKLAYILNHCLDRFALPEENLRHRTSGSEQSLHDPTKSSEPPGAQQNVPSSHSTESGMAQMMKDNTITEQAPSSAPNSPPPEETQSAPVAQVLIVDDNSINRSLLVAFMKRHNYAYQEAENGLEALHAYESDAPKFQTILMDMSMPIMDGMTSTRAIRAFEKTHRLPRCRIIALTGLASASARLEALSSGVDHFMTKPMNFGTLEAWLRRDGERMRKRSEGGSLRMQAEGGDKEETKESGNEVYST
ncbi:hypothetical protein DE146DRAFT_620053 [Phaeosphaeria sp. MPI-PUGE-AT-0046c]|nr:hypothetical protein DE146DRAFT_620053 [Phaeosphaeria sp. MPI-PUGE-AT-0046c]